MAMQTDRCNPQIASLPERIAAKSHLSVPDASANAVQILVTVQAQFEFATTFGTPVEPHPIYPHLPGYDRVIINTDRRVDS